MSTPAIKVENLAKRYRIGTRQEESETLIGAVTSWLKKPIRKYRELRKLQSFQQEDADDIIWALDDVSFEVGRGEVVGLIGQNGAGKSTLLKLLSRITDPTSGRAIMQGRISSLLEVGTGFHDELTGRENIYLNGTILGMRKSEVQAKFDEIVEFSGVEKFIDTPVKRYSSGMKVRLGFAVAAHLEPEILLVDEVLAVGDVAFQKKCLGKMDEVTDSGRTVMFVSHNMGMIRSLCPRTILLEDGKVTFDGDTAEAISRYMVAATGEMEGEGQIQWTEDEAPGEEEVRLRAVRALGPDGHPTDTFDIEYPVRISIDYDVVAPIRGMRIVMRVVTKEGVVAFASTDHGERGSVTHEPGSYRSVCTIPPDLMNRGNYQIQIHIGVPNVKELVHRKGYLKITMAGHAKSGTMHDTASNWPGVVTPKLNWSVQSIQNPAQV